MLPQRQKTKQTNKKNLSLVSNSRMQSSKFLTGWVNSDQSKLYICETHTFCRNLQSRGSSSFWSFVSIMCVRLSNDSLSLQLHTAELLTSEPCCSEVRKLKSSPWIVLMMKLEDTRESFLMVPFASCRSWSRSWTQNIGKGYIRGFI